ncbi:TonB-dependent receptor [Phenylobacterium sp.]|uniref:TonB-dependent receptor n=1 Tax=Phenylobacterium sp. TaxID=1871053 RepID=UPI0028993707|nr:TonB-dependent receptor [Phenylobacterium sp.]
MSSAALMALPCAAWADEAPTTDNTVEAVIVTATKRAENLEDLPQAVTVFGGRRLEEIKADSLESLAGYVPGLEMQTFAPGRTRITVRGVSPDEQTGVTTVSYYLDEIPLTAADQRSQPTIRFYDISQVEVLRGPQGTLYGEGAMGGTIRIITNKPDTDAFAASMKLDGYTVAKGSQGYVADGMINLPLVSDKLAVRLVAEQRRNAGWIDQTMVSIPVPTVGPPARYVTTGKEKDVNSSEETSIRAALRFTPTPEFTADLTYIYNDLDIRSASIASVNSYEHLDFALRPSKGSSNLWNLTLRYDFDGFTLTSTSSQTNRDTKRFDPYEPIVFGTTDASKLSFTTFLNADVFTQELRAVSKSDQRLRWTVGGYFRETKEDSGGTYDAYLPATNANAVFYTYTSQVKSSARAVFGEAEFDLTDAITLIGGLRWFEEKQSAGSLHRKPDGVTPKATIRYRVNDDLMAYATYSEGYRSGGFNFNAGPAEYAPDTTKNYEIGAKYTSPDGRLYASGAAYYIDWSDMQFIQLDPAGFFTYIGNANKASSRGVEAEVNYRFTDKLWTQVSGNITSAHLDSDVHGNFTPTIFSGTDLPSVPPYKFNAIVGYETPVMNDYTLKLTAAVSFVGPQQTKLERSGAYTDFLFGTTYVVGSRIPASANGRLRAELSHGDWAGALYINNVWNDRTPVGNDNFLPTLGQPLYYLQPRTIGLELSAKF